MLKAISKYFGALSGNSSGNGQSFHPSDKCLDCGTSLMRTAERNEWHCPNLDCPAQIRERIEHWCSPKAMDIAGADAALIAKLVGSGLVRDVAELYRLKVGEIANLQAMDQLSARKFFDAITASQKREAWRLLFGLAVPRVDAAQAKALCQLFGSVDNVFAASADRLMKAEGVDAETARSIVQWHSDSVNRKLVRRLSRAGLNLKE
jgi:DNA ligase (NAD+)